MNLRLLYRIIRRDCAQCGTPLIIQVNRFTKRYNPNKGCFYGTSGDFLENPFRGFPKARYQPLPDPAWPEYWLCIPCRTKVMLEGMEIPSEQERLKMLTLGFSLAVGFEQLSKWRKKNEVSSVD